MLQVLKTKVINV